MATDDQSAYGVCSESGRFKVMDQSGHVVMVCHDEGSATHYAVLLNEAFRRGYKRGYREGRGSAPRGD